MTPEELAALIDSIPEVAEMSRNRATLLDLVTIRPMDDMMMVLNPGTLVVVWPKTSDKSRGAIPEIVTAWEAATNPLMDDALGWTPIPMPLTEGADNATH